MTTERISFPELTISDVSKLPVGSAMSHLRRALAIEAMSDPIWVSIDASRRSQGKAQIESLPILSMPVALACEGFPTESNVDDIQIIKQFPEWMRAVLSLGIGGLYGALLSLNSFLPSWYSGWADFGPAVSWSGTAIFGSMLGLIYYLSTQSFSLKIRQASDSLAFGYASFALHPVVGILAWVGCLLGITVYQFRRFAVSKNNESKVLAQVEEILGEPLGQFQLETEQRVPENYNLSYSVRWGRFTGSPLEAVEILCARALELNGYDLSSDEAWEMVSGIASTRSNLDTAAAVVAAEIWLIACYVPVKK